MKTQRYRMVEPGGGGGDLERTSMLTAAPQAEAAARKNAIPAGLRDRRSQCTWQRAQALSSRGVTATTSTAFELACSLLRRSTALIKGPPELCLPAHA